MKTKTTWTMPPWMEPYRALIQNTGGNPIEDLMNDTTTNGFNNSIRSALIIAVSSQVTLLECARRARLLNAPPVSPQDGKAKKCPCCGDEPHDCPHNSGCCERCP